MEIIVRGKTPKDTLFTAKCIFCSSILRAKRAELEHLVHFPSYLGEPDSHYSAECPVCAEIVTSWVEEPSPPPTVEYVAKERK
ncbi:hypothetical protein K5_092 [Pseudomonas phage K5]|uniref:Uncharacterized protein n=1 Tax=Pseudomonas phage vB_PaM_EPA1 TaxID=2587493 RepID=A0A4Y6EC69_9CAUD|nr:hypothetical protein K8_093 [Pseudomonas phage K8]YP_009273847.1 hypothetical protein BH773_gp136 [Pseudomonas phage K5]YP_010763084.1 hypothetical protein QE328_gp128 [Pseudomonas phage vB_PaM_EPA1]ALF51414.1 hypothetical protein K8_093 [Pseudomonas phage K8]AMD42911.1 hypothetical protein K5_092 [Pseudomonas phage K5]QDF15570.1 hypothetical protein EPA1_92 [Pseudomonas phage vB_PaM_EPA1]